MRLRKKVGSGLSGDCYPEELITNGMPHLLHSSHKIMYFTLGT